MPPIVDKGLELARARHGHSKRTLFVLLPRRDKVRRYRCETCLEIVEVSDLEASL